MSSKTYDIFIRLQFVLYA